MQWRELIPHLWLPGSIAVVILLAASPGLRRAIWLARVPVALAAIALVALAVPEQTQFLLAGVQTGWQALGFLFAVLLTGIGAWFWTRWSLNLAWQAREPDAAMLHGGFW